MSIVDDYFKRNCREILDGGVTETDAPRARWADGQPAYTFRKFGVVNRYDLDSSKFPALTLRRVPINKAVDELLWIWQKKSSNIRDLGSHIWDAWADEDGSIGKAYGYQMGARHEYKEGWFDQVDRLIYDLKNNPDSRRMITNMYTHADLHDMRLYPCAYSVTITVTGGRINMLLNQRSQDMLVAFGWNVAQYAVLLHMLANVSGYQPGEMLHVIADAHIYDRHVPLVRELLDREPYPAPSLSMPALDDFYAYTPKMIKLTGYRFHEFEHEIPVAV